MNVSNLLSHEAPQTQIQQQPREAYLEQAYNHQYPTRRSLSTQNLSHQQMGPPNQGQQIDEAPTSEKLASASPTKPKNVTFELHFEGAPRYKARLPMRVQIFPHDTTDSIISTVKNFYGLYDGAANGVSFEDAQGNTLIAQYENFRNEMVVYMRVIPDYSLQHTNHDGIGNSGYRSASPRRLPQLDDVPQMLPPQPAQILNYGQPPSRPASRLSRKQSASPRLGGRMPRAHSNQKTRSRSGVKSQPSSFQANLDELNGDTHNGYSSSDGGAGSVTSSRKARSEQLASAEISVENIVEGGRRKRAKFESSELPLFVPPQIAAPHSISSISPQRRSNGNEYASPATRVTQRTISYNVPLQSPQSYTFGEQAQAGTPQSGTAFSVPSVPQHGHRLRDRISGPISATRSSLGRPHGAGILPTPDPTVASCISDEDVALQLMRLGDASNISHGRTSASTFDDAFSGRADAASSMTSDTEDESDATEQPELPVERPMVKTEPSITRASPKKQRKHLDHALPSFDSTEPSGDEVDGDYQEGIFKSELDDHVVTPGPAAKPKLAKIKTAGIGVHKSRSGSASAKSTKSMKQGNGVVKKTKSSGLASGSQPPISPASLLNQPRKTSSASTLNFQHQLAVDEDDLSSKPRCQRCRKSKKGCDRQRPCQRCKDAGIGIDGCVSEDEGNGRKGRYGRHMGVPVKKGMEGYVGDNDSQTAGAILTGMAGPGVQEKSKKRKR